MARMRLFLTVAGMATFLGFAPSAQAVTCGGLQPALDDATSGTVVSLDAGAHCFGHFTLPEGETITLTGGEGATLDGNLEEGQTQILSGNNVGETTISNLIFRNGCACGDERDDGTNPFYGGAITIAGNSPLTIEGNRFLDNFAQNGGGAVYVQAEEPRVRADGERDVTLRDNSFDADVATRDGGGAHIDSQFPVDVSGNDFLANRSDFGTGGGLFVDRANPLSLVGNTFSGGTATYAGGGAGIVTCNTPSIVVEDNVFDGNRLTGFPQSDRAGARQLFFNAVYGAGLAVGGFCFDQREAARQAVDGFELTQSGNDFTDNRIPAGFWNALGAGEAIVGISAHSTDDTFTGNLIETTANSEASAEGGGLGFESNGTDFEGRNLVAAGNAIDAVGGGSAPTRVDNPAGDGGGIYFGAAADVPGELRLFDSTVAANEAATGSGIDGDSHDGLTLYNSIVHGNLGATDEIAGFDSPTAARAASGTRDVRSSIACVDGSAHPGTGNRCVDPRLADPAGGDVHETASSPSIDAGSNALVPADLAGDYEGDARIRNARVDMGADEARPPVTQPPVVTPGPNPPPPAAQGVQGAQQRSCVSRRAFRIRLRVPRGKRAVSATVRVNHRRARVVKGKRLRSFVVLRGLPKGRFTVRITIRLRNGRKISGKRIYHTCVPRRPGDGPPRV